MPRYILRSSTGAIPAEQLTRLRSTAGLKIVDESPKMLLVEGEEKAVNDAAASMKDVTVHPEKKYQVPSPHPSVPKPER